MYPVSEAYKNAIAQNERNVRITGTITLKDESIINITDADIVLGSLYVSEQCVSGEDIEVGNVYASELGLELTSPPLNPYSLDGARIIINYGINVEPDPEEDPAWEYVPLGYFYVTEIERKQTTVNLKALDGMILFDTDLSGVLTTGTPYALVSSCCTKAGVVLANDSGEFAAFANGGSSFTLPAESKIETCRDLIMWVCQLTGTFARMNRLGQLEIVPVTAGTSVKTIAKQDRFTSDVSDFYVKITKVAMKVGEEEYSQGTAGMTLTLEENPLLAGKSEAEINAALAEILAQVAEAEYTPYNVDFAGDPALQAGDWVRLTGVSNINGPEVEYSRDSVAYHPVTGEEIPADTPIFMPFSGDKQGLLMEEGTINKYTAARSRGLNPLRAEGSIVTVTPGQPDPFGGTNAVRIQASGGTALYKAVFSTAYVPAKGVSVSGQMWVKNRSDTSLTVYSNLGGRKADVLKSQDWIKIVWENIRGSGSAIPQHVLRAPTIDDSIDCDVAFLQYEEKPYCTSWQLGGVERANPTSLLTLPEALPATFGIGIAAKMLHAHDAADRTFWECGGYRCYFDSADNKIKLTNGVVTAETAAVSWGANDYVGIYAGRDDDTGNLFIQAKIAGAVGEKAEVVGDTVDNGTTLYVGSRTDGSESSNAVLADFVLHDRPEDIDPEGYLYSIPGGGE
jgi:hypothetical protein